MRSLIYSSCVFVLASAAALDSGGGDGGGNGSLKPLTIGTDTGRLWSRHAAGNYHGG